MHYRTGTMIRAPRTTAARRLRLTAWRTAAIASLATLLATQGHAKRSIVAEQQVLRNRGILCDVDSLQEFFASLTPAADAFAHAQALIAQLGHEDFKIRESAMRKLMNDPGIPLQVVRDSSASDDAEVRWRSQMILETAAGQGTRLIRAALSVIAETPTKGLAQSVLANTAYYDTDALRRLAQRAIMATIQEADAERLRDAIHAPEMHVRVLALRGLMHLNPTDAVASVRTLLQDEEELVRLLAAAELANRGEREAVWTLAQLLDSENLTIRRRAIRLLRDFTGIKFNYRAHDQVDQRALAAKAWIEWLQTEGANAQLASEVSIDQARLGRILVCFYDSNRVVEYDLQHNVVWEQSVPQPWGCFGMPNGNRLVTSFQSNSVIEYDDAGKEVWRIAVGSNPSHAERLENGNTLVALYSQNKIVEIDPAGSTVNTIAVAGRPVFFQRTASGNTIVTTQKGEGVVDYAEDGKKTLCHNSANPFSGRRLDNGNLLVAESQSGRIVELDSKNKPVWSKTGFQQVMDAVRMEDGKTLIGFRRGIAELDLDGKILWSDQKGRGIRISYY